MLDDAQSSQAFAPLRVHGASIFEAHSPDIGDLQRLLDGREPPVRVASGTRLRIVPEARKRSGFQEQYEPRIYLKGELQVRPGHWHDIFNALTWLAFPRAKAALNSRHFSALEARRRMGASNRGRVEDALTLFDEGGVIVASSDSDLLQMLREWRWKELFWRNRDQLRARACFMLFGHAIQEKMLRPFTGMTGRGILFDVAPEHFAAPLAGQLSAIDAMTASHLLDPHSFATTRELAVVPVLGVPGWCTDNERESYYDNTDYFRPQRSREMRGS